MWCKSASPAIDLTTHPCPKVNLYYLYMACTTLQFSQPRIGNLNLENEQTLTSYFGRITAYYHLKCYCATMTTEHPILMIVSPTDHTKHSNNFVFTQHIVNHWKTVIQNHICFCLPAFLFFIMHTREEVSSSQLETCCLSVIYCSICFCLNWKQSTSLVKLHSKSALLYDTICQTIAKPKSRYVDNSSLLCSMHTTNDYS